MSAESQLRRHAVWAVPVAIALYLAWLKQPGQYDDAFIYLRYARNLVEGNGWAFNPGEAVNGTTGPLNTICTALLAGVTGGRYFLAQIVLFGAGAGSAAACVWLLLRRHGALTATLGATAALCTPFLYWLVGMETAPLCGLAAGAVLASHQERYRLAGLLAGLATLMRGDAILLCVVLAVGVTWRHRTTPRAMLRPLLGATLVAALPITAWAIYAWLQFGSPLPNTVAAKFAQTSAGLANEKTFLEWGLANLEQFFSIRGFPAAGFLIPGTLGVGIAIVRRSPITPLLAWALLQLAAYAVLGLPNYHWYYVPTWLALSIGVAVLAGTLWSAGGRVMPLVVFATFLYPTAPDPRFITSPSYLHYRSHSYHQHYFDEAAWMRDHYPQGSSLACTEIGILGFELHDWVIIDMLGLVMADGPEAVARGELAWWLDKRKPDYVLLHVPPWPGPELAVVRERDFQNGYVPVHQSPDRILFRRKEK